MKTRSVRRHRSKPSRPASNPTAGFLPLPHRQFQQFDRLLGYAGNSRYVCFHYEPRGEEVMWNDGKSFGFGTGGWQTFLDEIAPVATTCNVQVGAAGMKATHVLLVDRIERKAYFADRSRAEALVATQVVQPGGPSSAPTPRLRWTG